MLEVKIYLISGDFHTSDGAIRQAAARALTVNNQTALLAQKRLMDNYQLSNIFYDLLFIILLTKR